MKKLSRLFWAFFLGLAMAACQDGNTNQGTNTDTSDTTDATDTRTDSDTDDQQTDDSQSDKDNTDTDTEITDTDDDPPAPDGAVQIHKQTVVVMYYKSTTKENRLSINAYDQLYDDEFYPLNGFPTYMIDVKIEQFDPIEGTISFPDDPNSYVGVTAYKYEENGETTMYDSYTGALKIITATADNFKATFSGVKLYEFSCDSSECEYNKTAPTMILADTTISVSGDSYIFVDCDREKDLCKN